VEGCAGESGGDGGRCCVRRVQRLLLQNASLICALLAHGCPSRVDSLLIYTYCWGSTPAA
jgi:hypothetical protein